ncbi:MAG TPA: hypothetical protein VHD36_04035 [Pirellulales bacterium]|nr:hypothetical protein [Pirellulales bacterium]
MKAQQRPWIRPFGVLVIAVAAVLHSAALLYAFPAGPPKTSSSDDDGQESDDLRGKPASKKPLLVQMAEEHGYRLGDGEDVKRIAPPFEPIRAKYYHEAHPGQAAAINDPPDAMLFYWSDRDRGLKQWKMNFGGHDLRGIFDFVAEIKGQAIEGPDDLMRQRITGDWIVRVGTRDFRLVKQLEEILRHDLSLPIRLEFREVERPAFVVTGEYKFHPLDEKQARLLADYNLRPNTINIFGKSPVPNSGAGGGSGHFSEMLEWLGEWIQMPVVSDLENPPTNDFTWYLHARRPMTKQTRAEDHDPQLVMANFVAQTGLKVSEEVRPVRVLFVVRREANE